MALNPAEEINFLKSSLDYDMATGVRRKVVMLLQ